jgi:hypothetical protein
MSLNSAKRHSLRELFSAAQISNVPFGREQIVGSGGGGVGKEVHILKKLHIL